MAYEYDIFLSYRHIQTTEKWLNDHFLFFLEDYLEDAVGYRLKIFKDRTGILSGDSWPTRIKLALAHSRCLIAIWSRSYFMSHCCNYECAVMLHRARQLGFGTELPERPKGLILPVIIQDGEYFPEFSEIIQPLDLKNYILIGDGFKKTEIYPDFQIKLRSWAEQDVVSVLDATPPWRKEWGTNKWIDDAIETYKRLCEPKNVSISLPSLS